MCLSFVPPFITTCIANEDKRDDKRRSNLPFFHTFPTQHAYLSVTTVSCSHIQENASITPLRRTTTLSTNCIIHTSKPCKNLLSIEIEQTRAKP